MLKRFENVALNQNIRKTQKLSTKLFQNFFPKNKNNFFPSSAMRESFSNSTFLNFYWLKD
jgi:hypothetical protein